MSGSVSLEIITGTDWATQITWNDATGNGVPFTLPVMEIRQDLNPTSPLILRFDTTDTTPGDIEVTATGTMLLTIPAANTLNLPIGNAFFDLFLTTAGNQRARLLFGTVAIRPHVTATA